MTENSAFIFWSCLNCLKTVNKNFLNILTIMTILTIRIFLTILNIRTIQNEFLIEKQDIALSLSSSYVAYRDALSIPKVDGTILS